MTHPLSITNNPELKRKLGRRSGGDRRSFSFGIYIPERRKSERRTGERRGRESL
jgi:hypothetical protein